MKVNTDGVLLGALAQANAPKQILDIGTGTGVIALMLAQRFAEAEIDAVEIDKLAATTAAVNFQASSFASRLKSFPLDILHYFMVYPEKKFDLIVSNPPFFLDDLKSTNKQKELARHTDAEFFQNLCFSISHFLAKNGHFWVILPQKSLKIIKNEAKLQNLHCQKIIHIKSFEQTEPHREVACFGFAEVPTLETELAIYAAEKVYTAEYRLLLKDFLTIF
ncbi:MAG: tRNA1(Val) (adenine(37)-N6)-methyltransferase [Sphingobacteriaceae bacterium]